MSMTREDIMRELELLPVWQLKQPLAVMPILVAAEPPPIAALEVTQVNDAAQVAATPLQNVAIDTAPLETATLDVLPLEAATVETSATDISTDAMPTQAPAAHIPAAHKPDIPALMAEAAVPVELPSATELATSEMTTIEITAPEMTTVEKIATPWLLFCPLAAAHTEAQALLHNMVKAMRLLSTDVVLLTDASQLMQYQAQYQVNSCVLFGLAAAQHYLYVTVDNIEALRGQPHLQAGNCWVTYHPTDLLQNPSLKRAAWQDLCAALERQSTVQHAAA